MRYIAGLIAILATTGCTRIVFNVPQPADERPLSDFPETFQGTYLAPESEQDTMIIGTRTATFIEFVTQTINIAEFAEYPNISLKDGLLYDTDHPEAGGLTYTEQDSAISYSYYTRTSIGLSDSLVVKQSKEYLVANASFESDDSEYWDVFLLKLNDARDLVVVGVGDLRTPEDTDASEPFDGAIADFTPIVPFEKIADDTYLVSPSDAQFLKLIKKGLFSEEALYRRVR